MKRFKKRVRESAAMFSRLFRVTSVLLKHQWFKRIYDPVRRMFGSENVPTKPDRIKQLFEDLGGSYIKLGQIMALQPDLIPPEVCNMLLDLMDRVTPFGGDEARRIFARETGRSVDESFDSFDDEPLSTASIGQVHVAVLNGEKVAVKVQRPEAEAKMIPDIRIASFVISMIRFFHIKKLRWMIEPMSEFINWTWEELDYRHETRYQAKALENSRGEPFEKVPKVHWEFTTRRIAVSEFLTGITTLDVIRLREKHGFIPEGVTPPGYDGDEFCKNIVNNFLDSAFDCGLFHADLHPANLMVMDNNVVGYFDYGITGVLSEHSRRNLMGLTLAYAQGNFVEMADIFVKVSTMTAESDVEKLKEGLRTRSKNWTSSENQVSITSMMLDWVFLSRDANIWPQRDVVKYIRCSVAMDGLIKRLNPDFDVSKALAEASRRHLEMGMRRHVFSYDNIFRAFADTADLILGGTARVREAFANMEGVTAPS
ncbi:MAG: ubiquinone biosynthesis protein [Verrucomicrobiales bacterium]|jgi:ubiquinone biosynthesis protein